MKLFKTILITLTAMIAFSATAHVELDKTIPAENAQLTNSPQQLELVYSSPVQMVRAKLLNADKQSINFGFRPSADALSEYTWKLPALKEGKYTVDWVVLGQDGHKMSGTYQFKITGEKNEKMDHQQHNHNH